MTALHGPPVLYTLFVWWFSTGVILYLDGLPRRTYVWSLAAATILLAAAGHGLVVTRDDVSVTGAYVSFTCGIVVWGWLEMTFLMGILTGPRRTRCPEGSSGWTRAAHAFQAIVYHEFALGAGVAAVAILTSGGANRVGLWTILVLWAMRESAKLNVFLGVRNLYEAFLPEHLRYLESYFSRKPMNLLFPFSVSISSIVATLVWAEAMAPGTSAFQATGLNFAATLLTLAVLEHWFLILPLPVEALWEWSLKSRRGHRRETYAPGPDGQMRIAARVVPSP